MTQLNDDYDYNYVTFHQTQIRLVEKIQITIAIISTICSASVVFILILRRNVLLKDRPFIHIILMIAIADLLTSFTYSFGYPDTQKTCALQGFFGVLFSRSSWLYTVGLVLQLSSIVLYRQFICSNKRLIISIAVFNIVLAILPFTTGTTYGGSLGTQVCFFAKGTGTYQHLHIWEITCFFSIQIISFSIILLCALVLFLNSRRSDTTSILYEQLENAWHTVLLYPLGMLGSWLPNMIYGWYFDAYLQSTNGSYPPHALLIGDSLIVLNSFYGIFLTIIFFTCTKDASLEYIKMFKSIVPSFLKDVESNDESPYFKM